MQSVTSAPARRRWLAGAGHGLAAAVGQAALPLPALPLPALPTPALPALALPMLALAGCTTGRAGPAAAPLFTLGVASGFPGGRGVTLWTRLAPRPREADGGMPAAEVTVRWQLAADPAMTRRVAAGRVGAHPDSVHAVHVDVDGLAPDREYWYRFEALGQQSPVGRTRTLPLPEARRLGERGDGLRIAVASCQNIEHGWFAAHRHIAAERPDLVLHVGDYIYETTWGRDLVRPHGLPTARTLADYRARYSLYRQDPDLQAAHAAAPWFVVQDDHEVANDYAGLAPERLADAPTFAARRMAAWQAWYEHMPVPARLAPANGRLPRADAVRIGDLLSIYLLDTRQFRAAQACPPAGRGGGNHVVPADCAALGDPSRSLLGTAQESWLDEAFAGSATRWNLVAQQTLVAPLRQPRPAGPPTVRTDGWDGYPAARARLLEAMLGRRLANPVVVGGDLHAHYVADLRTGEQGDGRLVAAEFVTTSISSQAGPPAYYARQLAANPHLRFADGSRRGYLRLRVTAARIDVEALGLDDVRRPDSGIGRQAAWAVEAGRAGAQPA